VGDRQTATHPLLGTDDEVRNQVFEAFNEDVAKDSAAPTPVGTAALNFSNGCSINYAFPGRLESGTRADGRRRP
jgi:hypothetical protein